jgi:hypothetical protein
LQPNYSSIVEHCNLWRNFDDIQDSWASVEAIIDYYGNNQDVIVPNAGPGHWNDPDMVRMLNYWNSCNRCLLSVWYYCYLDCNKTGNELLRLHIFGMLIVLLIN